MRPSQLLINRSPDDLRQLVNEILQWQATGVLIGDSFEGFCRELQETGLAPDSGPALRRMAESLVLVEAARRYANGLA